MQPLEEGTPAQGKHPRIVVFSSLFPHAGQPNAGLFIRERMFRVGERLPIVVIAPQPWFPFQWLIRRFRDNYRPKAPRSSLQQGIQVYHPRFLAFPGIFREFDGLFMALGCLLTLVRLKRRFRPDVIDAHFAYPSGYAATLLGKWLNLPTTITLRGTEARHLADPRLRPRVASALRRASRIFSVSESLRQLALRAGIAGDKVKVIGNGVDLEKFTPIPRADARQQLGLRADGKILISVGGLVERKGFHRVIACLPRLCKRFPGLQYVVVGGPSPEGDMSAALRRQAEDLGVADRVIFTGHVAPDELYIPLSAADVFVLSTRYEGWANVFLEAMACGLPVVTSNVGGNPEVVCRSELGRLVPFGNEPALEEALIEALGAVWRREAIIAHAKMNTWDKRVDMLVDEFRALATTVGRL